MFLPPSPVDQLPGALGSTLALVLASILPNLREVNLSNTKLSCEPLQELTETCPRLEKITWNNIDQDFGVSIDGEHMMSATNLKNLGYGERRLSIRYLSVSHVQHSIGTGVDQKCRIRLWSGCSATKCVD